MIDPRRIEDALGRVKDQESFLQTLLAETLDWPLRERTKEVKDVSFEWSAEELRSSDLDKHIVDSHIWQLRRFDDQQEWGVFIIEFKDDSAFIKGRGLTGPLRKILRGLVPNARRRSDLPAWHRDDLLFICTFEYKHFRFAYFKPPKEKGQAAPLSTFGWGPDIPSRTACEFNLPALQWPEKPDKWLNSWQAAFDKEKLSKLFFDQYKALADILRSDLKKQSNNLNWAHDYTLQLLNRVMFLHFIQRKRWLGDNTDFLKSFWDEYRTSVQTKDTFFDKWLKVLFFEAFNDRFNYGHSHFSPKTKEALAQAPYLNGGLFTKNPLDHQADTYDVTVSDDRIGQILSFFGKYNFTVTEDTPLDKDVAVDPEMIGMVYESLVNISEDEDRRGEAGIFYTPRVEIDMMCKIALVDWLSNHLGTQHKELLYKWIFAYEEKEKIVTTEKVVSDKLIRPLKELLSGITVLDPACGSGSFLVGILHILDDLQERLEKCHKVSRSAYERRKDIIGSNLYGVDIKDWACHIAELRLWLTLIIDVDMTAAELHVRKEPLLPNFSFNIRRGDSLVQEVGGVDMAHRRGSLDLSQAIKNKLAELRREKIRFYNNDPQRKCGTVSELEEMEVKVFRDLLEDRIKADENKAKDLMRIQAQKQAYQQRNLITGELEGPAKQFTLDREQREQEIAALMEEKVRLENALGGLHNKAGVPFVWDVAFAEIFGGDKDGFDIVIGNPPYVRQENIANPDPHIDRKQATRTEAKKEYKAKVARSVYKAFPSYFDYKDATDKAARHNLDKKSDLYIYFYFKGLSLLNDRGAFCFITSNSLLDVSYGSALQEFLLRRSHVKMVIDNKAKRSFKSADINTVIVLLAAPLDKKASDDTSLANMARFVMFNVPFEDAVCADTFIDVEKSIKRIRRDKYRVFADNHHNLLDAGLEQLEDEEEASKSKKKIKSTGIGIKIAKYIGNKWGGKYLRAPEIYLELLTKDSLFINLGSPIWNLRYGLKTGLTEFFFISKEKKQLWNLEPEFCVPIVHSTREIPFLKLSKSELNSYVFVCPYTKSQLRQMKKQSTLKYIEWGEKQKTQKGAKHTKDGIPFPKVPSVSGNSPWYSLKEHSISDFVIPALVRERYQVMCNDAQFLVSNMFYQGQIPNCYDKELVWALLNSTLVYFTMEVVGRLNIGGRLNFYGPEISQVLVANPEMFVGSKKGEKVKNAFRQLVSRESLSVLKEIHSDDRIELDRTIFSLIGLPFNALTEMYDWIEKSCVERLSKEKSV